MKICSCVFLRGSLDRTLFFLFLDASYEHADVDEARVVIGSCSTEACIVSSI